MIGPFALILAAATPIAAVPVADAPARGIQVSGRATAEIVRAETSSPVAGEGRTRRQVRNRGSGHFSVEFE
ncbi:MULTISPECIES: hypothetical protein [unclassified Novosphingobium]|uniref:hypothetical protein n=1 Tax=unclassified Novosphingobium TaxID=2644732 RepID=UPI000ED5B37A|nr:MULTISPECIES: hypothetical protein [unclassified Novosphingobium]HCF24364.1 hypothetical protein [Novosphingobium sp.]HQV03744.1 hypothetical protein [Novosphingobium sp.]